MQGGMQAIIATTTAMMIPRHTVLPRLFSAACLLPSPKRSAASALPPLPISMPNAMKIVISGMAAVATERPISPMAWPRKMESITL